MGLKAFCVIAGVVVTGAFLLPTAHAQTPTSLQQALIKLKYPANTPFPSNFLDNSTLVNSTILLPPTEAQWAQIVNQTNGTANYYFLRNLNLAVDGTSGGGLVVNTLLPGYNINVANSSQFWYVYGEAVPAVRADKSACVPFGEGNSSSVCHLKRTLVIANTSVYDYLTTQPNLSMMVELIDSWPNLKTEFYSDVDDAGVVVAPNNTAFMTWMNETGQNFTSWKSSPEAQQFLENSVPVFWDNGPFQGRLDILEVATNELGQPPQALYYYNATGGATRDNIIFLPDVPKNRQGVAAKIISGEPVPYGKNYVIVVDAVPVASNLTASDFGEKNSTAPSPAPSPGPGESPAPGTAGGPPGAESPALIVVGPTTTPSPAPSPSPPGSSPTSTAAPLSMARWSITGLAGAAALCLALL